MADLVCSICNKKVKTYKGLVRHQATSTECKRLQSKPQQVPVDHGSISHAQGHQVPKTAKHAAKRKEHFDATRQEPPSQMLKVKDIVKLEASGTIGSPEKGVDTDDFCQQDNDEMFEFPQGSKDSDNDSQGTSEQELEAQSESESDDDGSEEGDEGQYMEDEYKNTEGNNHPKRQQETFKEFQAYADEAEQNRERFLPVERSSIKLMHLLLRKKAPLDTYQDVMRWHLQEQGLLGEREPIGTSPHYISREVLVQKLRKRYHMEHQYAKSTKISLPHAKSKVVMWRKDARDNVLSLLTDPRWEDDDWLFFENNPFKAPPEDYPYLEDVNTGEAYRETYKRLITNKDRQILVPILLYIDGAVTGQFDNLQVTALKMTIGILNRRARDREYAWRNLGFVPTFTKEDTLAKQMFVATGHVASNQMSAEPMSEEKESSPGMPEVEKAADYHTILGVLLDSLKQVMAEGMVVDIFYRGTLYSNIELVFFIPFVKCDGDEGDKLCLHYRVRRGNVKQLCRYCLCPREETDDYLADYSYKSVPMLKRLYDRKQRTKLKNLSQANANNAFHDLRFGLHNDRGIHGACPVEMLHGILLGIFMYTRDCFFYQMGKNSQTAMKINALSRKIGVLLARQSDRNKPRTKFSRGIAKGKLMAKEYSGVLLVMSALLQCEVGKSLLKEATSKKIRQRGRISDWSTLVETLLQWESYLTLGSMQRAHVTWLEKKNRFMLYLFKKCG